MNTTRKCLTIFAMLILSFNTLATLKKENPKLAEKKFIDNLVMNDNFKEHQLEMLFKKLHKDNAIIEKMNRPFERATWDHYKTFFITQRRINSGAAYWELHKDTFNKVEKKYGVPASLIVAIIGVETAYGLHEGNDSALQTLFTLSFYYPPRSKYFKKELRELFLLTRENHLSIESLKSSYAGAIGIPQFMPSSYRYYGVSGSQEKRVDLFHNHQDAITSIANYLAENGWSRNRPVAVYTLKNTKPKAGIKTIKLTEKSQNEKWAIYHNFDVIMSYNHSVNYAMAVFQLSQAIEKQYYDKQHQKRSNTITSSRSIHTSQKQV